MKQRHDEVKSIAYVFSSLLFLTLLAMFFLSGCAGVPEISPHVIDSDISECREYKIVNPDTLEVKKVKDWPIEHCNGFWAVPPEQARLWKEWLLKQRKGNNP